jgi:lysyl-tRNA synthetase class 2
MERLHQRHQIIATIRKDLYAQEFLEIETPLLVKGTCPDIHIDSIEAGEGYLVTSTEYQIKRMIVGGFEKVFTLTKNFRAYDRGRFHSTEFTMLEWARAYDLLDSIEEDAMRFIRKAFCLLFPNQTSLIFNGHTIDFLGKSWERLTVRSALQKYLGLENLEDFSLEPLLKASKDAGLALPEEFSHDKHCAISCLMDLLQPYLGIKTPTFLQEWPAYLTSSAPISSEDPFVAERSELYIGGIEIADGFPFLRDVQLQRDLFKQALENRKELKKPAVIIDERFLNAMDQGLPDGAGMALGVDRLVMVLTGSERLADVQAFDWDEL